MLAERWPRMSIALSTFPHWDRLGGSALEGRGRKGSAMSRRLAWPGFRNARDLGGLPLHPRGQTRFGELVRSDLPSGPGGLSVQTPVAYGVRTVIDLRTPRELLGKPSPLRQLPGYRHLPLLLDDDFDVVTAMGDLGRTYRWKVDNRGQAIAAIMSFMAGAPSGGILFHCLAG